MSIPAQALPVPPPPFWDTVWFSDALVVAGFAIAIGLYWATQRSATREQRKSTLAHLKGVKAAMTSWGDSYFTTDYAGVGAYDRARIDYLQIVEQRTYVQNFKVPTEPLETLIQPPGDAWPIEPRTVEAAGVALHKMTVFNQMVGQQSDFNAQHAIDFRDDDLNQRLAEAAELISQRIHGIIGDSAWYRELVDALDANIALLESLLRPRRPSLRRPKLPAILHRQKGGRSDPA